MRPYPRGETMGKADEALDPLLVALFDKLPEPGRAWEAGEREAFIEAARAIFKLIYAESVND